MSAASRSSWSIPSRAFIEAARISARTEPRRGGEAGLPGARARSDARCTAPGRSRSQRLPLERRTRGRRRYRNGEHEAAARAEVLRNGPLERRLEKVEDAELRREPGVRVDDHQPVRRKERRRLLLRGERDALDVSA